jgi:hypothetical protein
MRNLGSIAFLVLVSAHAALAADCAVKTALGNDTAVPIVGASSLTFKGLKPILRFVAAPTGAPFPGPLSHRVLPGLRAVATCDGKYLFPATHSRSSVL